MDRSFENFYQDAQHALDAGSWATAVNLYMAARNVAESKSEIGLAYAGEALSYVQGGYFVQARPAAIDAYTVHTSAIQECGENANNLSDRFGSALVAGRVCLAGALKEERNEGSVTEDSATALIKAWEYFDVARADEAVLGQRFTHMVSRTDHGVVELAVRSALATSFDDNRSRDVVAIQARQARIAARKTHGLRSAIFRTALVATMVNRLVTPHASLRRRMAVRLATLPGVL